MLNKKIAKRLLALAISLLLVVGTIPVLAEDLSPVIVDPTIAAEDSGDFSEEENSFVYKTISEAINSFVGAPGKIFLKGTLTALGSEIEGTADSRGEITIAGYGNSAENGKLIVGEDVAQAGWLKGDLTFENLTIGTSELTGNDAPSFGFDSNGHTLTFGTGTVSAGTLNIGGRYDTAGNNVVFNPGEGNTLNVDQLAARLDHNDDPNTKGPTHYVIESGTRVENIYAGINKNNGIGTVNMRNDFVLDINGGYFRYLYLGSMCYQAAVANKADTIININKLDARPDNGIIFGHGMSQAYQNFWQPLNKSGNIAVIINCANMPGRVDFYNRYWPSYYLVPEDNKYFMIISNNYDPEKVIIVEDTNPEWHNVKSVDYIINTVNGVAQPVFEDEIPGDDTSSVLKGFTFVCNDSDPALVPVANGVRLVPTGEKTEDGKIIYDLSRFKGTRVAKTLTDGSGNIIETHTTDTEPVTITFIDSSTPIVTTDEHFAAPDGYKLYSNISDAIAALGSYGGLIYIKGDYNVGTDVKGAFANTAHVADKNSITILGWEDADTVATSNSITFGTEWAKGVNSDWLHCDLTLNNITVNQPNSFDAGFYSNGNTLTLGKNIVAGTDFTTGILFSDFAASNNIVINAGTFNGIFPVLGWFGDATYNVDTNITLNGGNVYSNDWVPGRLYALGKTECSAGTRVINGDINYTVNGGSFYGISLGGYSEGSKRTTMNGNITFRLNGLSQDNFDPVYGIQLETAADVEYNSNIAVIFDLKEDFWFNTIVTNNLKVADGKKIMLIANNLENTSIAKWDGSKKDIIHYNLEVTGGSAEPVYDEAKNLKGFEIKGPAGTVPYASLVANTEGTKLTAGEDGLYDLSAYENQGVVEITFDYATEYGKYYVKYGGTGNGSSPYKPAKSVAWLINNVIARKHFANETIEVYIMQDDAEILYNSTIYGGEHEVEYIGGEGLNTPDSHITAWTSDADTTMVAHAATIVIKSYEDGISETNYLAYTHKLGANTGLALQGPTVFDNINLVSLRGSVPGIYASGHEVTFTENASHYRVDVDQYSNPAKKWDGTFPEAGWVIYEGTGWVPSVPTTLGKGGSINFNATKQNIEALYISAHNIDGFNFTNPVNLYLNAEVKQIESYQAKKLYIGNSLTNFAGGINIAINKTAMLDFNIGNPYNIENIPTVGKGIQLIHAETYSAFQGHMLDRLQNVAANALATVAAAEKNNIPLWHIVLDEPAEGVLDFMFDASGQTVFGKYAVKTDKTLIAFNKDKEVFTYSKDGVLDLSAFEGGRFWVQFADEAEISSGTLKVGDTIVATKDITLTVADIPKNAYEGRAFIGWQKDGKFIETDDVTLAKGETLESIYVDYDASSEFYVEGIQMRVDKADSIRFVLTLKDSLFNKLTENGAALITEELAYGSLVLPTELTYGMDLVRGEAIVDREGNELATPLDVPGINLYKTLMNDSEKVGIQYTVAVTGVTGNKQIRNYSVQGYVRYYDANGNEQVLYSGYGQSSLYRVALRLADDEEAPQNYIDMANIVVNNVKTTVKADYLNYVNKNTTTIPNVLGLTNLTIKKLANGLQLSDFDIDWKYNEGDSDDTATNILDIADTHFVYNNRNDFAIGNPAVISSGIKRDQSFLGNEDNAIRAMQFAMTADKTIIAGDLFDYLSEGCAQVAKRLLLNYNVDYKGNFDTVRAIVGNHEETRAFGDIPDTGTVESNRAWLKDHWIEGQDPVYEMEIVRNANGKNPVMNIMIHNGSNDYRYITDEIYEQFLNDLNTAREQNIPVLIFQHISINVVDGMKHVTDSAAAPLTESKHYAANSNSYHERTKEMYNTITDNADVIKGIFAAHNHDFYYGEISGTGENGTGHKIPQVMVMSNTLGEGNVFRINVK